MDDLTCNICERTDKPEDFRDCASCDSFEPLCESCGSYCVECDEFICESCKETQCSIEETFEETFETTFTCKSCKETTFEIRS